MSLRARNEILRDCAIGHGTTIQHQPVAVAHAILEVLLDIRDLLLAQDRERRTP
jgi:hypothetical protein